MDRRDKSEAIPQRKSIGQINHVFQDAFSASEDFPLRYSFILDSGSSIHVSHDLERFSNFRMDEKGFLIGLLQKVKRIFNKESFAWCRPRW